MGPRLERTKVDELAEMFLRDYRINGKKSLGDGEARWKHHLMPFFGGMRALDVTSEQLATFRRKNGSSDRSNY